MKRLALSIAIPLLLLCSLLSAEEAKAESESDWTEISYFERHNAQFKLKIYDNHSSLNWDQFEKDTSPELKSKLECIIKTSFLNHESFESWYTDYQKYTTRYYQDILGSKETLKRKYIKLLNTIKSFNDYKKDYSFAKYKNVFASIDFLYAGELYSRILYTVSSNSFPTIYYSGYSDAEYPKLLEILNENECFDIKNLLLKFENGTWKILNFENSFFPPTDPTFDLNYLQRIFETGYLYNSIKDRGLAPFNPPDLPINDSIRQAFPGEHMFIFDPSFNFDVIDFTPVNYKDILKNKRYTYRTNKLTGELYEEGYQPKRILRSLIDLPPYEKSQSIKNDPIIIKDDSEWRDIVYFERHNAKVKLKYINPPLTYENFQTPTNIPEAIRAQLYPHSNIHYHNHDSYESWYQHYLEFSSDEKIAEDTKANSISKENYDAYMKRYDDSLKEYSEHIKQYGNNYANIYAQLEIQYAGKLYNSLMVLGGRNKLTFIPDTFSNLEQIINFWNYKVNFETVYQNGRWKLLPSAKNFFLIFHDSDEVEAIIKSGLAYYSIQKKGITSFEKNNFPIEDTIRERYPGENLFRYDAEHNFNKIMDRTVSVEGILNGEVYRYTSTYPPDFQLKQEIRSVLDFDPLPIPPMPGEAEATDTAVEANAQKGATSDLLSKPPLDHLLSYLILAWAILATYFAVRRN